MPGLLRKKQLNGTQNLYHIFMGIMKIGLLFLAVSLGIGGTLYYQVVKKDREPENLRVLSAEDIAPSRETVSSQGASTDTTTGAPAIDFPDSPLLGLDWKEIVTGTGSSQSVEYRNGNFVIRNDVLSAVFPGVEKALDAIAPPALGRHTIESMNIDTNTITSRTIRDGDIRSGDLSNDLTIKNLSIAGSLTLADNSLLDISDDSLDFSDIKDGLSLDASTDVAFGGSDSFSLTNSGSGRSFTVNDAAGDTSPFVIDANGSVGVGTAAANRKLEILETASAPQLRLSKSSVIYADIMADSAGDLSLATTGGDIRALDENLWVCASAGCPSVTPTGQGNIVVENAQVFGNNFSTKQVNATTLGTYDSTGDLVMTFDEGL